MATRKFPFNLLPASVGLLLMTGCGGENSGARFQGRVRIVHETTGAPALIATHFAVINQDGGVVSPAFPVSGGHPTPEVSVSGNSIRLEYFRGLDPVGQQVIPIDLSDGKEDILVQGNPVGYVNFVKNDAGYQLMVGTNSVFIKGVGFDYTQLDQDSSGAWFSYVNPAIAKIGANCIRLYGIPWTDGGVTTPGSPAYQAQFTSNMLAYAAQNNMYVLVGVFVDGSATTSRVTTFINSIQSDPNFAQVIGYCVGNEVDSSLFPTVNSLAATIKGLATTPAQVRPVMSAFPAVSSGFVSTIQSSLPNLDWMGVNTFYGSFDANHSGGGYLNTQASSLSTGGWTKPWAITEYYSYDIQAPDMPNQVLNGASKGYMLECNSTLNATNYANSYSDYIASTTAKADGSVGGFMLNYGPPHNSKLVASWLEPFTYTGSFTAFVNPPWNNGANQFIRLGATDAVAAIYGGNFANACPQIVLGADGDPQGISCSFKATLTSAGVAQAGGSSVTASVIASDANAITFSWYLIGGSSAGSYTGDITLPGLNPQAYEEPTTLYLGSGVSATVTNGTQNTITFNLPTPQQAASNNYQLRVIVNDSFGGGATAAVGFPMQ